MISSVKKIEFESKELIYPDFFANQTCVIKYIIEQSNCSMKNEIYDMLSKHRDLVLMKSQENILKLNEYRKLSPFLSYKISEHKKKHQIYNKVINELESLAHMIETNHSNKASFYYFKILENLKNDLGIG